jgi:hypothetical protein
MTEHKKSNENFDDSNDSLFESRSSSAPSNDDFHENDLLFGGGSESTVDQSELDRRAKQADARINAMYHGALLGGTAEGVGYLGNKAVNYAIDKLGPRLKEYFQPNTNPQPNVGGEPSLNPNVSGTGLSPRLSSQTTEVSPYNLVSSQGTPIERVTGPGQQINNYAYTLMKHTPEAQTITRNEAKNILSPAEAQARLEKNVKLIRKVQESNPQAKVIHEETGLMSSKTIPWTSPYDGKTYDVPIEKIKDPVTGKTRTVPDQKWIDAHQKVVTAPKPVEVSPQEAEFRQGIGNLGSGVRNFLSHILRGAGHGANIGYQMQEGKEAVRQNNIPEAVARTGSATGSIFDLARPLMPEAWNYGVGKYISPLAYIGNAIADLAKETKEGEYQKIPSTVLGTGMLASPLSAPAGAAFLYLRDNPEAQKRFIEGMSGQTPFAHRGFGLD